MLWIQKDRILIFQIVLMIWDMNLGNRNDDMLLRFSVENYRSIKDKAVLDFEAATYKSLNHDERLLKTDYGEYLPVISINGKNGGGKSNVLRAMWVAVQFIVNAHRTQTEVAEIPVTPFLLDDISRNNPTKFEFDYICEGYRYQYGFAATKKTITEEHLSIWQAGRVRTIFLREYQNYTFQANKDRGLLAMIQKAVRCNQLFLAVSNTLNYQPCISAMKWFRSKVFFSRNYADIDEGILSHYEDREMLKYVRDMILRADIGIADMSFGEEVTKDYFDSKYRDLSQFIRQLKELLYIDNKKDGSDYYDQIRILLLHTGMGDNNTNKSFPLSLADESDGTVMLMTHAMLLGKALNEGGLCVIDDIETRLHPHLIEYIVKRFQNQEKRTGAQLLFTTNSIDILERELIGKDQYYFVDKNSRTGITELYSLCDFLEYEDEKIGRAYLIGKYGAVPYIQSM